MEPIWAERALTPDGWKRHVTIALRANGAIDTVTPDTDRLPTAVDILAPAPANAHSHAFQRAMAGLAERRGRESADSFWTWRRLMYRFLDTLTPEQVEAITAFVQMEMLEAGYASSVEFHYLHHGPGGAPYDDLAEMAHRVMAAAHHTGIGLTLAPVLYQYGGCDGRPLGPGQVRFGNDVERFSALCEASKTALSDGPGDWTFAVAAHSLRAVAREDLPRVAAIAPDGPVHMHLAEQVPEVDEVTAAYGARPVEWVLANVNVDARWSLVHCTQMQPRETEGLARSGATAVVCPITEANLGDGVFDGVNWLAAGGLVSIGSDSNVRISLSEELRTLEYSQRLRDHVRAALATPERSTGRRILDAVTQGGATSAGRRTGQLAPGYWADMLALNGAHADLVGTAGDTTIDAFVFAGDDRMVTDVWSAGRHMVREGRHIHRDAIEDAYRAAAGALREGL